MPSIRTTTRLPPHTRGWTRRWHRNEEHPAGFPRTRGDGPRARHSAGVRRTASPAHAGMDPTTPSRSSRRSWLPRTRGDGPWLEGDGEPTWEASPHTRGWTRMAPERTGAGAGFPAHAGMDLRSGSPIGWPAGLPRTRGDGPSAPLPARPIARASPAHAGMDPDRPSARSTRTGLPPHTRGWTRRLRGRRGRRAALPGFPAHAGMDPGASRCGPLCAGLPRTRGDGPAKLIPRPAGTAASPHTRGWTPDAGSTAGDFDGFPAHAGMDPGWPCGATSPARLPRTRGDGPDQTTVCDTC